MVEAPYTKDGERGRIKVLLAIGRSLRFSEHKKKDIPIEFQISTNDVDMIRPTTANLRKAEITVDFNAAVSSVPNKRCVYIVDFNIWVCLQVINGFYVYT